MTSDRCCRILVVLLRGEGGLAILVSRDVRRFGPVITYLATVAMAFGVVITGVDAMAKMPTYWVLAEGPPAFAISLVILLLNRRVQRDGDRADL